MDGGKTQPEEPDVDDNAEVNTDAGIDITAIQCLCGLEIPADTSGNAEATADGSGDCGFGDQLPKVGGVKVLKCF